MDNTTYERELRRAERVLEDLERELWTAAPAFERLRQVVGAVHPDDVCNKKRVQEGIGRACDELRRMFDDVYSAGTKIPF